MSVYHHHYIIIIMMMMWESFLIASGYVNNYRSDLLFLFQISAGDFFFSLMFVRCNSTLSNLFNTDYLHTYTFFFSLAKEKRIDFNGGNEAKEWTHTYIMITIFIHSLSSSFVRYPTSLSEETEQQIEIFAWMNIERTR